MIFKMKANSNFREQFNHVTSVFMDWNECEQTVALYSLIKKLTHIQTIFIDQVLQQSVSAVAERPDIKLLQKKANDKGFITGLNGNDKGKIILQLLYLLPLLQAGNETTKMEYLKLIPDVLSHTIDTGVNIEESRQLLSYTLIHPVMTVDDRVKFRTWLGYLEERFTHSTSHTRPTASTNVIHDNSTNASVSVSHSEEGLNNLFGSAAPSPSVSSSGGWQSVRQTHPFGCDRSGLCGGREEGGAWGSNVGEHQTLRATNSHAGTFPGPRLNRHMALHATSSAPPQFKSLAAPLPQSQGTTAGSNQLNKHTPLKRTSSIHPNNPLPMRMQNPEKTVTDWLQMHPAVQESCASQAEGQGKCRSGGEEHAPLSPQNSVTSSGSSGSDCHQEEGPQLVRDSFVEEGSGMREVPVWLKTLRLHKYSYLFRQMTYEDMLNIKEEWLEAQKVTKGARHKIIISIQKLCERQQTLRDYEKCIMQGGSIREVLGEMKSMLSTPIKAYTAGCQTADHRDTSGPPSPCPADAEIKEGNLPGQFLRLMCKVCTQLLTGHTRDDDSLQLFFQLIDKCVQHEAFTFKQKTLLTVWKQQAQTIWLPLPPKFDRRQKSWGNTFPLNTVAGRGNTRWRSKVTQSPSAPIHWCFGSRRSNLAPAHAPVQRNNSLTSPVHAKLGPLETKEPLSRTHSAPLRSCQPTLTQSLQQPGTEQATDTEINASLDFLCRTMTEHALGGEGCDKGSTF